MGYEQFARRREGDSGSAANGEMKVVIGPKRSGFVPGWWCEARVDGLKYDVGVLVIPTENARNDVWCVVRDANGAVLWQQRVAASVDARELLRQAGIVKARR